MKLSNLSAVIAALTTSALELERPAEGGIRPDIYTCNSTLVHIVYSQCTIMYNQCTISVQ